MKRQRYENTVEKLNLLHEKYDDLVWYARSKPNRKVAIIPRARIQMKWPAEVEAFEECEDNWQHGFNSGMLAAVRYISAYLEKPLVFDDEETGEPLPLEENYRLAIEQAEREFPQLDT